MASQISVDAVWFRVWDGNDTGAYVGKESTCAPPDFGLKIGYNDFGLQAVADA